MYEHPSIYEHPEEHHQSGSGFVGFILGVVATVLVAFGLLAWTQMSRAPPLRTAELSIPVDLPAPPGMLPDANEPALPIQ